MRSTLTVSLTAALLAIPAWGAAPALPASEREALAAAAAAIQHADYRGDRDELERQIEAMPVAPSGTLGKYWLYWTGFAHWRRALAGEIETPTASDLLADLGAGAAAFRAALAADPNFDEARIGLMGCLSNQLFLLPADDPRWRGALEEVRRTGAEMGETAADNPRRLWLTGGTQFFAPPPYGGDVAAARATYFRGLRAARREALAAAQREPWVPAWGAPELLMSLAYLHAQGPSAEPEVARAYAEGALAMVPGWHYVAEVLLPQIEALGAADGLPAAGTGNPCAATTSGRDERPLTRRTPRAWVSCPSPASAQREWNSGNPSAVITSRQHASPR